MKKKSQPGFKECMKMMRKHDRQIQEDGFYSLLPRANDFIDDLISEFYAEKDHGLRCWLLELIGEARHPKSFDLLVEQLSGGDESLRQWAVHGLRRLNTKEARHVLYEHGLNRR